MAEDKRSEEEPFSFQRLVSLESENHRLMEQLQIVTAERDELQERYQSISREFSQANEFILRMSRKLKKFTATKTSTLTSTLTVATDCASDRPSLPSSSSTNATDEPRPTDVKPVLEVEPLPILIELPCLESIITNEQSVPVATDAVDDKGIDEDDAKVEEPKPEEKIFTCEKIVTPNLDTISQFYLDLNSKIKQERVVMDIRERFPHFRMVIFCNGPKKVKFLKQYFKNRKKRVLSVHARMAWGVCESILKAFCHGSIDTLIATELPKLNENVKLKDVSFMMNYEMPNGPQNYYSRISLCGPLFEKSGMVINLISDGYTDILEDIEKYFGTEIVKWT